MWPKNFLKYFFPVLLVVIAILSHRLWFVPNSVLTFSDWYWWPDDTVSGLLSGWGSWVHVYWGLGTPNVQIYFNIFMALWSVFVRLGLGFDQAVKINMFIPIAIMGFLSPYILALGITKNRITSFAVALFYASNTYFITIQTAHLPIAFVNAFAPLLLYWFIKVLQINKLKNWLLFIISFSIISNYEIRITYILGIVLGLFFIVTCLQDLKKYYKNIILSGIFYLLLNLYWILPTLVGGISENVIGVAARGLFGDSLYTIQNAFSLSIWNWTGGYPNQSFELQKISSYFWLFPILALSSILNPKINSSKKTHFFLLISILGVFLTKQSSPPFTKIYEWLYWNFPGFGLFRESSKLYLLTALGYTNLIALQIDSIKSVKKFLYPILIFSLIFFSFINLKPLITGQIETLFINRTVPDAFLLLDEHLKNDPEYYRVLSIPRYSKWMYFSEIHPRVFAADEIENSWRKLAKFQEFPISFNYLQKMDYFVSKDSTKRLFDQSSIRYIVVPPEDVANNDNFFVYYSGGFREYSRILKNIPDTVNRDDFGPQITIHENYGFKPHLYLTVNPETLMVDQDFIKINYLFVNPAWYTFTVPNLPGDTYLNFTENYNPNWRVRIGDFVWWQALLNKNYFLNSAAHFRTEAGMNAFLLNNTSSQAVTIFYLPQSYLYLGLILSGFTLFVGIILIVINNRK